MAIFRSIGKALGLGSAQDFTTLVTGSPALGAAAGAVSRGVSSIGQQVGIEQASQTVPAETQGSGTVQAGALVPFSTGLGGGLVQGLRGLGAFSSRPSTVGFGLGLGAGEALDAFGGMGDPAYGMPKQRGVTRKMQAQAKKLVELVGIEQAAAIVGLSVPELAMVVTKKFRPRSSGISGAQLKSAQRTINKIVHMNNKLADAYGTAKRAPVRRRTTTMAKGITQIKN